MSDLDEEKARILALMAATPTVTRRRKLAIHEAGHTVVARHLGLPIESVDIEEHESEDGYRGGGLKLTASLSADLNRDPDHRRDHLFNRLVLQLAGGEAVRQIFDIARDPLSHNDVLDVERLHINFPETREMVQEAKQVCTSVIEAHRPDIEKIADALEAQTILTDPELRQILA